MPHVPPSPIGPRQPSSGSAGTAWRRLTLALARQREQRQLLKLPSWILADIGVDPRRLRREVGPAPDEVLLPPRDG